jgi:subtilisin family serine protease
MNLTTRMNRIVLCCLICVSWLFSTSQSRLGAQIDPRVLEDTADGKTAHFLVVFRQQMTQQPIGVGGKVNDARAAILVTSLRTTSDQTQQKVRDYLEIHNTHYTSYWIANVMAVEGNQQVVEKLARFPEVELIEPDRIFTVNLEVPETVGESLLSIQSPTGIEPGLTQVHAPELWALGQMGVGIVYAVADTGINWQHAALINQYRGWNGVTASHDYNWWDAIREDINPSINDCGYDVSYPCDDYGHGTHVLGTGVGDDGGGNQIGMAPGARWIGCRNMDDGVGRPSTYIECLQFFTAPTDLNGENPDTNLRADVISNSYGCPTSELCDTYSLRSAVGNVRAAGIFMSVSAGNSGSSCQTISDPPALEVEVFTIGAVDSTGTIASFSSRGPVTMGESTLMKPELVAPGVSIRSSLRTTNSSYGYMSGTSMAAPHVAGAVALLWGAFPSIRRNVAATEYFLEITAQPHTTLQGCGGDSPSQVPNNVYGWGLLDVKAAYDAYALILPEAYFPLIYIQN